MKDKIIVKRLPIYLYGLIDPISNEIGYIGQSNNPKYRYMTHRCKSGGGRKKLKWIRLLKKQGKAPILKIYGIFEPTQINEIEKKFIACINPKFNEAKGGGAFRKYGSAGYVQIIDKETGNIYLSIKDLATSMGRTYHTIVHSKKYTGRFERIVDGRLNCEIRHKANKIAGLE